MPLVALIRDGRPAEAPALEALQRRASDVWEEYRAQLAAHPDAITPPHEAIAEGRVRVAVYATGRPIGFSTVLAIDDGRCELDDLFVEPDVMRRGVGRLLVQDVAERAAAAGATHVDVVANPNALAFYARLGFEVVGDASTRFGDAPRMTLALSWRGDAASIADVMHAFFRAVSFEQGGRPAYGDLRRLFIPSGRLIRAGRPSPEISSVEEFVRTREAAFAAGRLRSFEETELGAWIELFGDVAHRFSPYRKRATTDRGTIETRGAISTQLVRTAEGWQIASMAWDDERPGLTLPERLS